MFTTVTDPADHRPADLVNRHFQAAAPNRLWFTDNNFVRTRQGLCYAAFVTDACTRKIAGLAVSATVRTENLPLKAYSRCNGRAIPLYPG